MKRLLFAFFAVMLTAGVATAQSYMVVDSEKVFKSIAAYNEALSEIETLSATYQKQVDDKFAAVETLYNNYMAQRASLSQSARQAKENEILSKESEATKFQESLFGTDGELMKKRMELIQPIQKRVFETLESFAKQYGYDLIIDIAANPTVLYYSTKVDFTDRIIEALK
ncbi:MAG: OmpH family outer membrane protein [Alistipes sp.]|jgi:outer membrane protein|nr:OmpH family outer membrane protein [Alistipes sp.]MBO5856045.1 OmpH family outer membrane protein [Alistipes sp.]